MFVGKMRVLLLALPIAVLFAVDAGAADKAWYTAAEENEANTVFNYTVYDESDRAVVEPSAYCPNDDASEWNVSGIQYVGVNYMGHPNGGIRVNISPYIEDGDILMVRFNYRSPGYGEGSDYSVRPVIEVSTPNGTVISRYELNSASQSDKWTSYESGESEPIHFTEGDSVSLSMMNTRGFWHMNGLTLERYGEERESSFIYDLNISGAVDGSKLRDGELKISGAVRSDAVLYAALYNNERFMNVVSRETENAFDMKADSSGADTLKLLAWDNGMTQLTDVITVNTYGTGSYERNIDDMKNRYENSFLVGTIYRPLNLDGADREILLKHFNAVTPENIMKPDAVAPYEWVYNWEPVDNMIRFAEENGLTAIGHTLVWHQQTPNWLTDGSADEVQAKLERYITEVVSRYKGRVKGWDVVNEAVSDNIPEMPASWSDAIRRDDSAWYRALGDPEYLYNAFLLAHKADPDAELYYNDYNLDMPYKREAAALLVEHINDRYKREHNTGENLIDAVGMQSHYCLDTNIDEVRKSIERFRAAGVRVNITELDVCLNRVFDNGQGDSESADVTLTKSLEMRQAVKYAKLMSLYEENADIIDRVTFWGYNDAASWRAVQYPLMFNADLSPKKAYYAIMEPENYR